MSRLKSLGAWLRGNPVRPFAVVSALIALNLLTSAFLRETAALTASLIIMVAILVLGVAYALGGRS